MDGGRKLQIAPRRVRLEESDGHLTPARLAFQRFPLPGRGDRRFLADRWHSRLLIIDSTLIFYQPLIDGMSTKESLQHGYASKHSSAIVRALNIRPPVFGSERAPQRETPPIR